MNEIDNDYNEVDQPEGVTIFFGAGGAGTNFAINSGIVPDFYTDNNDKIWGRKVNEVPVISPGEVVKMKIFKIYITSGATSQILNQLIAFGVDKKRIKIPSKSLFGTYPFSSSGNRCAASKKISEFISRFSRNGPIVAIFGTALGFHRDKDFIAWDFDIDLLSPSSSRELITDWVKAEGCLTLDNESKICFVLKINSDTSVPVSVDFYDDGKPKWECRTIPPGWDFPVELFKECKKVKVNGYWMNIPNPPQYYLGLVYGNNWSTPDKEFTNSDYKTNIVQK